MANWHRPSDGDVKRMATLEVRNLPCYIANGADAEDLMEDLKTLFEIREEELENCADTHS